MTLPKALSIFVGSAAALAILPATAATSSEPGVKSLEVSIAGYDLDDPAHAQIVYYKIQQAAKRVCRLTGVRETLRERSEEMQCRADAITNAVAQFDSSQLTLVMNERTRAS